MMVKREDTALGCNPPGFVIHKTLYGGHCATSIAPLTSIPQSDTGVTVTRVKGIKVKGSASSAGLVESGTRGKKMGVVRTNRAPYAIVPKHLIPKHESSDKQEFLDELLIRSRKEFSARLKADDSKDKRCRIQTNWVCHICHARKPFGCIFPCGNERHAYCDMHCSVSICNLVVIIWIWICVCVYLGCNMFRMLYPFIVFSICVTEVKFTF